MVVLPIVSCYFRGLAPEASVGYLLISGNTPCVWAKAGRALLPSASINDLVLVGDAGL